MDIILRPHYVQLSVIFYSMHAELYIYRFFLVLFTETSLTFIIAVSICLGTCLGSFEASSAKNKYNIETILIDMHMHARTWMNNEHGFSVQSLYTQTQRTRIR